MRLVSTSFAPARTIGTGSLTLALLAAGAALAQTPPAHPPLPIAKSEVGPAVPIPEARPAVTPAGAPVPVPEARPASVAMAPVRSAGDPPPAYGVPTGPVLSPTDEALFEQAHAAADRNDWATARAFAAQGSDPLAKRLIEWRYLLDERSGASFDDISNFLFQYPHWPRTRVLRARAEKAMPPDLDPHQVISWFGNHAPVTSEGEIRLGAAEIATGQKQDGANLIRKAWIENTFSPAEETQILQQYGDLFTDTDQTKRLDYLLSHEGIAAARRQAERVDAQAKTLADARLQLKIKPASVLDDLSSLGGTVRSNPGFILDQARALRIQGDDQQAWSAMMQAPTDKALMFNPARWWNERHIMARDALKAGQVDLAYQLASNHAVDSGTDLAEAEFLSGWIALRFLKKPEEALPHFRTLAANVSYPISRARAYYWIGRTEEALHDEKAAAAAYRTAASEPSTFYGQLAMTRLTPAPVLHLRADEPSKAAVRQALAKDERVRAMRILAQLDQPVQLRIFAFYLAAQTDDPARLYALADMMTHYDDKMAAVRIAKQASYNNALFLHYLDPVVHLPRQRGAMHVEPALILGLTRQESEFDPKVVSAAGARGLMQLLPSSARRTAHAHGLGYHPARLTDPDYNMELGIAHLGDALQYWNGSYILAIASYNAGENTVQNWIDTYGDPRDASVDPIDWIEMIPYGETRNYVQRVIENMEVYRNRLAGHDVRLRILSDLYRPRVPPNLVPVPQRAAMTQEQEQASVD